MKRISGNMAFVPLHNRICSVLGLLCIRAFALVFIGFQPTISQVSGAQTSFEPDSTVPTEESFATTKSDLQLLESGGHYTVARKKLYAFCLRSTDLEAYRFWLELDLLHLQKLQINLVNHKLTVWAPTPVPFAWKDVLYPHLDLFLGFPVGHIAWTEAKRRKFLTYEKAHPIATIPPEQVKLILEDFDGLRESQRQLKGILEQKVTDATDSHMRSVLPLLDEQKRLCATIRDARCSYVSYDVVSPYLARARQLTHIAINSSILKLSHSTEALKEAAMVLNMGAYGSILVQCQQDVKLQFVGVWKEMKETAGTAEMEELKVIQSYADTISQDKPTGVDVWWNGR